MDSWLLTGQMGVVLVFKEKHLCVVLPGQSGRGRRRWDSSCWRKPGTTRRCSGCSRPRTSTRRASCPTWTPARPSTCTGAPRRRRPPCRDRWCRASCCTACRGAASRRPLCPPCPACCPGRASSGEPAPLLQPGTRGEDFFFKTNKEKNKKLISLYEKKRKRTEPCGRSKDWNSNCPRGRIVFLSFFFFKKDIHFIYNLFIFRYESKYLSYVFIWSKFQYLSVFFLPTDEKKNVGGTLTYTAQSQLRPLLAYYHNY